MFKISHEINFEVLDFITMENVVPKNIEILNINKIWQKTKGENTVVAILDTGCDYNHKDLKDNIIDGRNFCIGESYVDYMDRNGHGTHVAGTIAAVGNNASIVGVAPKTKLVICKVLGDNGNGSLNSIIDALNWCVGWRGKNGERINVINMSLGTSQYNSNFHQAIKYVYENNIPVICAAGNEGDNLCDTIEISYPAYFDETISVAAIDENINPAFFTNTNDMIDISCPGVDVASTYPMNRIARLSGTSMACPHLTGATALIISKYYKVMNRYPNVETIYDMLKWFTNDIYIDGKDAKTGFGIFSF